MCKIVEKLVLREFIKLGDHARYIHTDGRIIVVLVHGNEKLGRGLISKILNQIELSREEYEKLRLGI